MKTLPEYASVKLPSPQAWRSPANYLVVVLLLLVVVIIGNTNLFSDFEERLGETVEWDDSGPSYAVSRQRKIGPENPLAEFTERSGQDAEKHSDFLLEEMTDALEKALRCN